MRDTEKTREQLMEEVGELRRRVSELERLQKPRRQTKKGPQEYSEELYKGLFEMSPDAILVTDTKGTVILSNPAIAKMSGYSPDEYIGRHFTKVPTLQAKEILKYVKAFGYLARGKVSPPFETTFRHKDGTLHSIEVISSLLKEGRKKVGSQVIVRDITEQKQYEGNLRKAAQEWRTTFDSVSDLVSVHDKDFKVVRVNKSLANFFKMKPQKLLGKHCYELFHGTKEPIPNCPHVRAMKTKAPATVEVFDANLEIHIEASTSPIFGERGEVVGTVHIVKDITERKKTEEALRESEERNRLLLDSAGEAIYGLDVKGNCTFANEACLRTLGYEKEADVLGKNMHDLIHYKRPDGTPYPNEECKIFQAFRRGEGMHVDDELLWRADGSGFPVEYWSYPIHKENNIIGAVMVFTDITERKQGEEALQSSEEKYHQLFELGSDTLFLIDVETGRILDLNAIALKMYGYSREEALQMKNTDFSAEPAQTRKATLESEKHVPVRYHKKKDGTIFPTDITVAYFTWYGKKVCIAAIRDITERKKAEEELQQSEKDYRDLFDNATDAIYIQDNEGRFLDINQGAVGMYGYPKEFFIGKTPEFLSAPGQNDMEKILGFVKDAFNGKPRQYDFWGIRKNGEVFPKIVRSQQGFYLGQKVVITFALDITERKQAEEALQESEERYRLLFNLLPYGGEVLNTDGIIVNCSSSTAQMLGYKMSELIGKHISELLTPDSVKVFQKKFPRLLSGKRETAEISMIRKDGTTLDLLRAAQPVLDNNGKVETILALSVDITERKRAEEELRFERDKLTNILDSMEDGIYIVNSQYEVEYTNPALEVQFGSTEGRKCYEYLHGREEVCPWCKNQAVFAGETVRWEWYSFKNQRAYDLVDTPLKNADGSISKLEMFRDITERKQAEERTNHLTLVLRAVRNVNQLITKEKDRDKLLKGSCDNLIETRGYYNAWIVLLDESGKPTEHVESGLGKDFLPMAELMKRGQLPTCMQRALKQSAAVITEDPASTCTDCPLTGDYAGRSGVAVRLEYEGKVYGLLSVSVLRELATDVEELSLFHEVATDIAFALHNVELEEERKQAEAELLLKNLVFERSITANSTADNKGIITHVNDAFVRIWGYENKEEAVGKPISDFLKFEEEATNITTALDETGEWAGEYTALRKDGTTFNAYGLATVIPDESGNTIGYQSAVLDISEQKRAEEERRTLEQKAQTASRLASVGEMAAGIAHEINNPLTGVIGFAHLLLQRDIPEDMRNDVKIIGDCAQRVSDIVKRMLTFARPKMGRREYIDIKQLIETTLALRSYELETNNIKVTTVLDAQLPWTMADGGQLQQVLLNLIINAETEMKLAHGKGNLSVKAETVDNIIRVSFQDDGPGIAKGNITKLFDPFFTTREAGQGTGLGLSVCHGIIKEHNGRIYVESELGKGATFVVELPILAEEKQPGMPEVPGEEPTEVAKGRILVVDDEPAVREFLTKLLVGKGHEVDRVDNANDALTKIKSERYSAILLDVKMPGMSGIELYQRVQKMTKSLAGRIIFMTGDVMGINTQNFLSETGAHYISKPINAEDLMKTINKILS